MVPGFQGIGDKQLVALVGHVLVETTKTLADIERRLQEAGVMPPDICGVLLHYGAVTAVVEDLPPGAAQRQLVNAGREIGKLIRQKFGEKIREQLEEKAKKEKN